LKTLISIDPGQSSGVICGTYSDSDPFRVTHAFQIEGGVEGFVKNVSHYDDTDDFSNGGTCFSIDHHSGSWGESFCLWYGEMLGRNEVVEAPTVLVEKFNARGSANAGFAYTSKSLEPLRIEGALIAMGVPITWVQPPQQYFLPGESKAKKKQAQHKWLKENGYAIMPKDLGTKDADDARSACAHVISWLRKFHKPTQDMFRKESR
jgi:hypothetical protein